MALAPVTLDDKYALESGRVFLTGTQALVRLPMMQRRRDELQGAAEQWRRECEGMRRTAADIASAKSETAIKGSEGSTSV